MDERNTSADIRRPGLAHQHRLDTGSAARSEGAGDHRVRPSMDAPRADSSLAKEAHGTTRRCESLGFDEALTLLRGGERVSRKGWNGKGQYIVLAVAAFAFGRQLDNAPVGPHLLIRTVSGDYVPWLASQSDLLAFDWCLVREEKVLVYGHGSTQADGARPETGHREDIG